MSNCPHQRLAGISVKTGKLTFDCRAFESGSSFYVSCGKCFICRRAHAHEWQVRCDLERKRWKYAYFGTLTIDNDHLVHSDIDRNGEIDKLEWRHFLRRVRKYLFHDAPDSMVFIHSAEYGNRTFRPHDHFCFFTNRLIKKAELIPLWPCGFLDFQPLEAGASGYVAGYTTKKLLMGDFPHRVEPYISCSPGIAREWTIAHLKDIFADGFIRYKANHTAPVFRYARKIMQRICPDEYEVYIDEVWNDMRSLPPPDFQALAARAQMLETKARLMLKAS